MKKRDEDDLGKFKMGLKTASLAMGKRLKVMTKAENSDYLTGIFDYDEAFQKNDWNFVYEANQPKKKFPISRNWLETKALVR